jgi:hypothetical protein
VVATAYREHKAVVAITAKVAQDSVVAQAEMQGRQAGQVVVAVVAEPQYCVLVGCQEPLPEAAAGAAVVVTTEMVPMLDQRSTTHINHPYLLRTKVKVGKVKITLAMVVAVVAVVAALPAVAAGHRGAVTQAG